MDEPRLSDLRVAIIGCGRMGRERARCVRALNARLEFVFDVDATRSAKVASEFGAIATEEWDQCFRTDIDAVFVCVAPGNRGGIEMACFDHRKPCMIEKPIGVSAAQCTGLIERLRRNPVINAVGYMNRYRSSVQMAHKILHGANVIGSAAHWLCGRYRVPWWQDERISGGPHNDQATHLFDLNRFLLGEIVQVEAVVQSASRVCCALSFHSGAIGTTVYSCEAHAKDIGIRIFAQEGTLMLSGWDFRIVENTITGVIPQHSPEDVFLVETSAFLSAVSTGNRNLVQSDIADAYHTQQLLDAVRESAAQRMTTPGAGFQWGIHAGA